MSTIVQIISELILEHVSRETNTFSERQFFSKQEILHNSTRNYDPNPLFLLKIALLQHSGSKIKELKTYFLL